jgi:hypothetical protein
MISDETILINTLWAIRIPINPLTDSLSIDKEKYWKREANEIIHRYLAMKKRNEKKKK